MTDNIPRTDADIIIVGAGPGGYETAVEAAASGLKVILVERGQLGGTCLNSGCIPTKALCHSAAVALELRNAGLGIPQGFFAGAVARRDAVVSELRSGVATLLKDVEIINAEASLTPDGAVEAGGRILRAPRVIIATGSRPSIPSSIEGAENLLTSDDLLKLTSLPASMIIIGGGVIGLEFASIFSLLGVEVTVVEFCPEIIPAFDSEIAKRLRMTLKRRGVRIMVSSEVRSVTPDGVVECLEKGRQRTLSAEVVAIAAGRRPVLPPGTEACGIATERGAIVVDGSMQTSRPGFYAIGDVTGRIMLAHYAAAQGRVALGLPCCLSVVPSAVFTIPECAAVGLTEAECAEKGFDVAIGRAGFRANGKAMAEDAPDGIAKLIFNRSDRRLLGAHILGAHASDLITAATVAITSGATADSLLATIFPHPTLGEVIREAVCDASRKL